MAANKARQGGNRALGEFEAIALLRGVLGGGPQRTRPQSDPAQPSAAPKALRGGSARRENVTVQVGIGDDAAVLQTSATDMVWSTDASLEHVHFDLRFLSIRQAAARAVHAAVSDLAAMGANPVAALVALELPARTTRRTITQIGLGQAQAASDLGCPIVGGNITTGSRLVFTTSVLGSVERGRARLRSGARVGDEVWLSHSVGWAALGLHLLQSDRVRVSPRGGLVWNPPIQLQGGRRAVHAWQRPRAKVPEGQRWALRCNALIDVSDGLVSEARHLASASRVQIILEHDALRGTHRDLSGVAAACGVALEPLVFSGGEDYALLATGPRELRPNDALVIGRVEAGAPAVYLEQAGKKRRLTSAGHDHLKQTQ